MMSGTVKFFNDKKGYGFITMDDGREMFVHVSGLIHGIEKGDNVEFDVKKGRKGMVAVDVIVVE